MVNKNKEVDVSIILTEIEKEVSGIIVGQKEIIHGILRGVLCNGHVLVEGVPGTAKTLIVKSMATVLGCDMKRIQFTVDLLPTDITGIMSYSPEKGFKVEKGPIFTNFVLADEINRSPPKTQSALLEAMQEKSVTIASDTYDLPKPFFVMATENPLENSGVYTLPEAQVDRFLFKLLIGYPSAKEEQGVLKKNTTTSTFESYDLKAVLNPKKIVELQEKVKEVFTSEIIEEYIIRIVGESRNKDWEMGKYISYGGSPRASIALYIASKAEALMHGRDYVIPEDVREVAYPVLRHRIILNYEAEAEGITTDKVIKQILSKVSVP
ncbi:MoxR family ATPase [Candidatus Pacearchaeota archaeon]|nr:MoxR family ATPase [Candidatus Pacearchaeota archaeon]